MRILDTSLQQEMSIFLYVFLAILKGNTVYGQTGPNAVALINGQTSLDCFATAITTSQWTRTHDGTNNPLAIAAGCSVSVSNAAYYRTEQPGGNICRLIIANATMQQAGVYTCFDGTSTAYRSLVTIIDSDASIVVHKQSEVVVGDQLNISCSINYNGPASPAPSLRPAPYWTTSPGQTFTSATYHPSTTVVTLVATVTVQKSTVPSFQCKTVFEMTGNTSGYNPTPPSDKLTLGATTQIDVQYGSSVPVITRRAEVIMVNDVSCGISVLMCTSTGNPTPNYNWFDTAENVSISDEQTLTLAEVNRNYKCEAYSTIRNKLYTTSTNCTVSINDSVSYLPHCQFPRNELTSIIVSGYEIGPTRVCSQGSGGLTLTCNAVSYPTASYKWRGMDGSIVCSSINEDLASNGTYHCIAYFDRALSNYTGSITFPNGTSTKTVTECTFQAATSTMLATASPTSATTTASATAVPIACNSNIVAIAMDVLFGISLAVNITILVIWLRNYFRAKQGALKRRDSVLDPEMSDLSHATSAPSAYEELRRPAEAHVQPTTYEHLNLSPPVYVNQLPGNQN